MTTEMQSPMRAAESAPQQPQSSSPTKKLTLSEKLGYGVGDMANGLALASTAFYLLFYLTNVVRLSPELAGAALMVGRLWDAITDPVMGWITDRTNTRWGKRRPYLLFGAIGYGASFFLLWTIPAFSSEAMTFLYVALILILFNTLMTVVFIPYQTLTASMTNDYNERTSLTGYRMVLSQIAFLIGATVPAIIVGWNSTPAAQELLGRLPFAEAWGSWAGSDRQGYFLFAALFMLLIVAAVWTSFAFTREEISNEEPQQLSGSPLGYVRELIKLVSTNRIFRCSLLIKLLSTCAATIVSAKLQYYVTYVLGRQEDFSSIIGSLFVAAIFAIPFWVWLSKRLGKIIAYQIGSYGYCIVLFVLLVSGKDASGFIFPIAVAAGVFHSAALLIPWTIIPDVVEVDEYNQGIRREGLLYGGTTFAYKLGSGLSIFIAGLVLASLGFDPDSASSEDLTSGILLSVTVIPIGLFLLSILAARRYELTAERHSEIVAELKRRRDSTARTSTRGTDSLLRDGK